MISEYFYINLKVCFYQACKTLVKDVADQDGAERRSLLSATCRSSGT
jgi:hypothetical protein